MSNRKGPKEPTGTFDNETTQCREYWYDGRMETQHSRAFIDSEQGRDYAYGRTVHPWGHFGNLPR